MIFIIIINFNECVDLHKNIDSLHKDVNIYPEYTCTLFHACLLPLSVHSFSWPQYRVKDNRKNYYSIYDGAKKCFYSCNVSYH